MGNKRTHIILHPWKEVWKGWSHGLKESTKGLKPTHGRMSTGCSQKTLLAGQVSAEQSRGTLCPRNSCPQECPQVGFFSSHFQLFIYYFSSFLVFSQIFFFLFFLFAIKKSILPLDFVILWWQGTCHNSVRLSPTHHTTTHLSPYSLYLLNIRPILYGLVFSSPIQSVLPSYHNFCGQFCTDIQDLQLA